MKLANCLVMFLFLAALPVYSQTELNADSESVLAARAQYSLADSSQQDENTVAAGPIAQFPRGRTFHPLMRSPRAVGYPATYAGEGSARHVLIGALIGFGLGAAIGAKANTDQHPGVGVKAAFLVGGVGALIGAAVGSGVHSFPSRYRRGRWPDYDENASVRRWGKNSHRTAANRTMKHDVAETTSASLPEEPEPSALHLNNRQLPW